MGTVTKKIANQKNNNFIGFIVKLFFCVSVITLLIFTGWLLSKKLAQFPITRVQVYGTISKTSKQDILAAISATLKPGFFMLDVATVKAKLQQLPWIETATVAKVWPEQLTINIQEKTPIARWRGKGIVTTNGDIIYNNTINEANKLPIFWAKESQAKKMLESYLLIVKALEKINLTVAEIEIMPDYGVRAILNNGIMLFLGQEGLLERVNRFTLAYRNKLQEVWAKIDYVDLRYVNGVAVGWKNNISSIYLNNIIINEDYTINV